MSANPLTTASESNVSPESAKHVISFDAIKDALQIKGKGHEEEEKYTITKLEEQGEIRKGFTRMLDLSDHSDTQKSPYERLMQTSGGLMGKVMSLRENQRSMTHRDRSYISSADDAEILCTQYSKRSVLNPKKDSHHLSLAILTKQSGSEDATPTLLLHGLYNKDGKTVKVEQLYMPGLDGEKMNQYTPPAKVDVTPENIERALHLAKKLTNRILNNEAVTQLDVRSILLHYDPTKKAEAETVTTLEPEKPKTTIIETGVDRRIYVGMDSFKQAMHLDAPAFSGSIDAPAKTASKRISLFTRKLKPHLLPSPA